MRRWDLERGRAWPKVTELLADGAKKTAPPCPPCWVCTGGSAQPQWVDGIFRKHARPRISMPEHPSCVKTTQMLGYGVDNGGKAEPCGPHNKTPQHGWSSACTLSSTTETRIALKACS